MESYAYSEPESIDRILEREIYRKHTESPLPIGDFLIYIGITLMVLAVASLFKGDK